MVLMASLGSMVPVLAQSAATYRQRGLAAREQGQYPEAIAAFQQAVALEPANLEGRVLLGWTLHRSGQHEAAADVLVQTFYLNPFDVPTLNALGIVYLVEGQLGPAITTHGWAAMLKPQNEIAHYNLSLAWERLGQYNWAIATAKIAADLEPTNPHPLIALALAHWGNGDRALAQTAYQQALGLDPRYQEAGFWSHLSEAGFSPDQLDRGLKMLANLQ